MTIKVIVNITFAVFAKNTTGSNPDISLGLKFLAKVDERQALKRAIGCLSLVSWSKL